MNYFFYLLKARLSRGLAYLLFRALAIVKVKQSDQDTTLIIGYLPPRSRGWVLEFLFRDLAKYASKSRFTLCSNLISAVWTFRKAKKVLVLSMHQSFISDLIQAGIPGASLASIYTHSKIDSALPSSVIRDVLKWLPMNATEANALRMAGANPEQIKVFPIGYDSKLFSISSKEATKRDIDVLFAGRFVDHHNPHYHVRKNYGLILPVVESLIADRFVVGILGSNWNGFFGHLATPPLIFDLPFARTPSIYRRSKVLVNLSLLEGGPISWLEAMASGCLTVSCPSGFPLDHINSDSGSYLLSPRPSVDEVLSVITRILVDYDDLDLTSFVQSRMTFLKASSFGALAQVLESMIA